jgi:hypothetical protein
MQRTDSTNPMIITACPKPKPINCDTKYNKLDADKMNNLKGNLHPLLST